MKDNELRREVDERLADIRVRDGNLRSRVARLENMNLSILPCPQCKHETIHQFWPYLRWDGFRTRIINNQTEDFHRCLNCGSDWVYDTETVAREYKPPKKNAKQKGG